MSEAVEWKIAPWQWPDVPQFWAERLYIYFRARHDTFPEVQARHARQAAAMNQ